MKDEIRTFLESPFSLDPASTEPTKTKKKSVSTKKKRKVALPPYIPFKSIYEQSDLSKLTERQRLMALKFQTNCDNANSLFLAVNCIYPKDEINKTNSKARDTSNIYMQSRSMRNKAIKGNKRHSRMMNNKLSKSPLKSKENNVNADAQMSYKVARGDITDGNKYQADTPGPVENHMINGNIDGSDQLVTENTPTFSIIKLKVAPLKIKLPFKMAITCANCKEDMCDLFKFLCWCHGRHRSCRYGNECLMLRNKLAFIIGARSCVCEAEESFYVQALAWGNLTCCRSLE